MTKRIIISENRRLVPLEEQHLLIKNDSRHESVNPADSEIDKDK